MKLTSNHGGLYSSALTPWSSDGTILYDSFIRFLRWQKDMGVSGFLINGSMGEFLSISMEERFRLAETAIDECGADASVIVGASAELIDDVTQYCLHAEACGAAAVLIAPLAYWRLSEREIFEYFRVITSRTTLPVIAYNTPRKTGGTDISPALLARLYRECGLAGVKESSYEISRIESIAQETGAGFQIYGGDDYGAVQGFALGATGWISGISTFLPAHCREIASLATDSSGLGRARALQGFMNQHLRLLYSDSANPIARTRYAIEQVTSLPFGPPMLPLLPLSVGEEELVSEALNQLGVSSASLT